MVETNEANMFKRISILDTWSANIKTLSSNTDPLTPVIYREISEWHLFSLLSI